MVQLCEVPFDPEKPVIAVKSFRCNGRFFQTGDQLPWQSLGVMENRVRAMYECRMIAHLDSNTYPEVMKNSVLESNDGLEEMTMRELKELAKKEGSSTKTHKALQIQAIREHRLKEGSNGRLQ